MSPYSPERRTALVLCGTGAHGAYHAGALRALQEAGVKIDIVSGQGIGAGAAALAAIGGSARVWEESGVWRSPRVRSLYSWTPASVALPIAVAALTLLLLATVLATGLGWVVPTWWTGTLVAIIVVIVASCAFVTVRQASMGRRAAGRWWWRVFGAPIEAESARMLFSNAIWDLIRGAAPTLPPDPGPANGPSSRSSSTSPIATPSASTA